MAAKKASISMPEDLWQEAKRRQKLFNYKKFSHYVEACIRAEIQSRATEHIRKIELPIPSTSSQPYNLNERSQTPAPRKRGIHKKQEN